MSRSFIIEKEDYQVVVIGGGLSGVCAAVAAARQGMKTVLVQNRPVLGGNSSAEIGVPPHGADQAGHYRHVRETGIIDEIATANARFPNHLDSPSIWSVVLWAFCREQENLTVYLNAQAGDVMTEGERIVSVQVDQLTTERRLILSGEIFIDCSGDGGVAYRAGAEVMTGREGRERFGESMAPEKGDAYGMGDSVYMRARDVGTAVPFPTPPWARIIPDDESLPDKGLTCPHPIAHLTRPRGGWWWIEHGGMRDRIADSELIRDELYRRAIGVWDHLKNRGDHGAENYVLESIVTTPGKRDSRRFVGDYIMVEQDVMGGRLFDDAVAYGGWHVDIHNPKGVAGDTYWYGKLLKNGIYTIPYRSLYSRNIGNLLFAGRNISASHVAFASTRVMLTCALMGQAAGNAAALCVRHGCGPRDVYRDHIRELQQELLRQDCYLPGIRDESAGNVARLARITASSQRILAAPPAAEFLPLDVARGQMFVLSESRLRRVRVLLENTTDAPLQAVAGLRAARRIDDFTSGEDLACASAEVAPGRGWVDFAFDCDLPEADAPYWLRIGATPGLAWGFSREEEPAAQAATLAEQYFTDGAEWFMHRVRGTHSFELEPPSRCYAPRQVISGIARPEKASNLWISESGAPAHLELEWVEPVPVGEVHLSFDHRLDRPIAKWAREGPAPELVRDYTLSLLDGERLLETVSFTENVSRKRVHRFSAKKVSRLRIDLGATWGGTAPRVFEVRVY